MDLPSDQAKSSSMFYTIVWLKKNKQPLNSSHKFDSQKNCVMSDNCGTRFDFPCLYHNANKKIISFSFDDQLPPTPNR